jgi:predicted  nucleic acid-binding Zn-ribbon protein
MTDPRMAESAAMKLAELSREIDELENGRAALLDRLDRVRSSLVVAGNRTTAMRASVDLLCEHITNVVMAMAELHALEVEMRDISGGMSDNTQASSGLTFEVSSLMDSLDEAEEQLERLSTILVEGKARPPRGH